MLLVGFVYIFFSSIKTSETLKLTFLNCPLRKPRLKTNKQLRRKRSRTRKTSPLTSLKPNSRPNKLKMQSTRRLLQPPRPLSEDSPPPSPLAKIPLNRQCRLSSGHNKLYSFFTFQRLSTKCTKTNLGLLFDDFANFHRWLFTEFDSQSLIIDFSHQLIDFDRKLITDFNFRWVCSLFMFIHIMWGFRRLTESPKTLQYKVDRVNLTLIELFHIRRMYSRFR